MYVRKPIAYNPSYALQGCTDHFVAFVSGPCIMHTITPKCPEMIARYSEEFSFTVPQAPDLFVNTCRFGQQVTEIRACLFRRKSGFFETSRKGDETWRFYIIVYAAALDTNSNQALKRTTPGGYLKRTGITLRRFRHRNDPVTQPCIKYKMSQGAKQLPLEQGYSRPVRQKLTLYRLSLFIQKM